MVLIEQVRGIATQHLLSLRSFAGDWPDRRNLIRSQFKNPDRPTRTELTRLGDQLSSIFQHVGRGQRTNADVGAGGAVWAALITWYLNLGYAGTDAIAFCAGKFAPEPLKDAMSVTYQNTSLRSDTDVMVLSLPGLSREPSQPDQPSALARLTSITAARFADCGLVNVQCKTTWNDNAQIPMLWNLIFQQAVAGTNPPTGFLLGRNGFSVRNLAHFSYSFVTVPTVTGGPAGITATGMPVRRVASLSGGAFWGHPTRQHVCRSLREFFGHQFASNGRIMPNVNQIGAGYVSALTATTPNVDTAIFGIR